jgi:hypothetical protein
MFAEARDSSCGGQEEPADQELAFTQSGPLLGRWNKRGATVNNGNNRTDGVPPSVREAGNVADTGGRLKLWPLIRRDAVGLQRFARNDIVVTV